MAYNTYTSTQKTLHWTIAILIIGLWCAGFSFDYLPKSTFKSFLVNTHKTLGVIVFFMALFRIIVRIKHPVKAFKLPKFIEFMGKLTHIILYFLIVTMPLSGWLMATASQKMPSWFPLYIPGIAYSKSLSKSMHVLHVYLGYTLALLVLLHIGATFYHVWRKEPILDRMLFKK